MKMHLLLTKQFFKVCLNQSVNIDGDDFFNPFTECDQLNLDHIWKFFYYKNKCKNVQ